MYWINGSLCCRWCELPPDTSVPSIASVCTLYFSLEVNNIGHLLSAPYMLRIILIHLCQLDYLLSILMCINSLQRKHVLKVWHLSAPYMLHLICLVSYWFTYGSLYRLNLYLSVPLPYRGLGGHSDTLLGIGCAAPYMLPPYMVGRLCSTLYGYLFIFPSCEIASPLYTHRRCHTYSE